MGNKSSSKGKGNLFEESVKEAVKESMAESNKKETWFRFAVVADQDSHNKEEDIKDDDTFFLSFLLYGEMILDSNSNQFINFTFSPPASKNNDIEIDKATQAIILKTDLAYLHHGKKRGAEFSVLAKHILADKRDSYLITGGDKTGLLFEINTDSFKVDPIGKLMLNKESELIYVAKDELNEEIVQEKGLKIEWMTRKKNKDQSEKLVFGSIGGVWCNFHTGLVKDIGMMWICEYSEDGNINTYDWRSNYDKIKQAVGALYPGWFQIEAIIWSEVHKKWFIAPRWLCINAPINAVYNCYGCNLLITADETFDKVEYVNIGFTKPDDNNKEYVESLYKDSTLLGDDQDKTTSHIDFAGAKKIGLLTTRDADAEELKQVQMNVAESLFFSKTGAKGFSCIQFVPGTNDEVIIGVRTLEQKEGDHSFLNVFGIDGTVFVEDYPFKGERKYEGLTIF